jgi:hypothetical protein
MIGQQYKIIIFGEIQQIQIYPDNDLVRVDIMYQQMQNGHERILLDDLVLLE